jgi:hypothetical protein
MANLVDFATLISGVNASEVAKLLRLDDDGKLVLAPNSGVDIGDVDSEPPVIEKVVHPFGAGKLTSDGVQYGTEVTGVDEDAYDEVDKATINQPSGYTLESIEMGLTAAIKSSSTEKAVLWKWQASDDGSSWEDLMDAETEAADVSSYTDVSRSGRFGLTGNFLGDEATFQVRFVIKAEHADEAASGKVKNSCYILCRYRRT